jgi:sugar lactone lactonase YvrE
MRSLTRIGLALLFFVQLSLIGFAQSGIITTVAGNGPPGYSGDGGPATSAQFNDPFWVVVDSAGNLFIVDNKNNCVRKVTSGGVISTVAGNGTAGYSGDGGPATSALLNDPLSVAVDTAGNLFIADGGNNRIRKVTSGGVISTVAGGPNPGFSGDGGPATSAQLSYPQGVMVDMAGNLFIADTNNQRVRKVTPGGVISTVAGSGAWGFGNGGFGGDGGPATSAQLNTPWGLAMDTAGNLFIGDNGNNRVRKVTSGGVISTVAGNGTSGYSGDGGPAASGQLYFPVELALDRTGNLFIADRGNGRIRKVTPGGVISTVAGNGTQGFSGDGGPATSAELAGPCGVAVDATGDLFIADTSNQRIRKVTPGGVTPGGVISTVAGNGTSGFGGDGGPATSAQLAGPYGVTVDAVGNLFIVDVTNNRIRKVTPGGVISTVAGNGNQGYSGDGGPATSAQLYAPYGVAVDAAGNLFIADNGNQRIRKVTPGGVISTVAGNGTGGYRGDGGPATSAQLLYPYGVAVDTAGNLFIADTGNNRVRKVTPGGVISTVAGNGTQGFSGDGGPATSAELHYPEGAAVDTVGNLFIVDTSNSRVRKVTPGGVISTVAGNGTQGFSGDGDPATSAQLYNPEGVAVDTAGNLFIADTYNNRIRKVTSGGVISTVAGNGTQGFSGDGGPATSAQLGYPEDVAVDTAGDLFIADSTNNRIRKVAGGSNVSVNFTLNAGGSATSSTAGVNGTTRTGYATVTANGSAASAASYGAAVFRFKQNGVAVREAVVPASRTSDASAAPHGAAVFRSKQNGVGVREAGDIASPLTSDAGAAPNGVAVFSFSQNGVTVTEAGVPGSPPTTAARIFIDYRSAVAAIPGRISAGTVDIDTGIAVVNNGSASADVTYTLRNMAGATLATGHGTIAAGGHFATFIDLLNTEAPDFVLPLNFQTDTRFQFASLEISSDQLISVLALRMTINQRGEALFTTTPTADLTQPFSYAPIYFPQFADGGGYTTSLVLLNTSDGTETGTLQLLTGSGNPLIVNQVDGTSGSVFRYSIPSGGAFRFQTDGSPATPATGWAQLTPDAGTSTPIGAGVFGYNPGVFLETESGIPATVSTTHARIYVDLSGGHDTGLAIANPTNANASITITAFQSDGVTGIGTSQGPLPLLPNGYSAFFADQLIAGLPAGFTGVLDITSSTPFAALTVRSLTNERNDFLLATFPIADMTVGAPSPIVFPQIADGGGYVTQFILIGAGGASSVTLNYYGEDGKPLAVGK